MATTASTPMARQFLGVDDGHAGLVGELPEIFGAAANADLDHALGVEHAVEHRLTERAAVMEFRAFVGPRSVAMRVDMQHADGPLRADRLQDGQGDRMVAADAQRNDARSDDRSR